MKYKIISSKRKVIKATMLCIVHIVLYYRERVCLLIAYRKCYLEKMLLSYNRLIIFFKKAWMFSDKNKIK